MLADNTGNSMAARMAMMAMTTSNSIKVKARARRPGGGGRAGGISPGGGVSLGDRLGTIMFNIVLTAATALVKCAFDGTPAV